MLVQFRYADPQPGGTDVPSGRTLRCSLMRAEAKDGKLRSARSFTVPIVNGSADVTLSDTGLDQLWHVVPTGVEGAPERWLIVPAGDGTVLATDLDDGDPFSVPIGPATVKTWEQLEVRIDSLADTVREDLFYPGVLVRQAGLIPIVYPFDVRLVAITAATVTPPVGFVAPYYGIQLDINLDGWSIFPNGTQKPYVAGADGAGGVMDPYPLDTLVSRGVKVTVDVNGVGTTSPGSDLLVSIWAVKA